MNEYKIDLKLLQKIKLTFPGIDWDSEIQELCKRLDQLSKEKQNGKV